MKTIFEYQYEGHELIAQICNYGFSKGVVYATLADRLHIPKKMAHFRSMATIALARKAVSELRRMSRDARLATSLKRHLAKNQKPKKKMEPLPAKYRGKPTILPILEQRRLIAAMKADVSVSRYVVRLAEVFRDTEYDLNH